MTIKELFSIQTDMNELKSLNIELTNLELFNPFKGNQISDMPKGGGGKDINQWYAEEKERIEKKIDLCKDRLQRDRENVDRFIQAAPCPEKDIIRFRVVNNMCWEDIGKEIGYSDRHVSRRFFRYIKKSEMSEKSVDAHAIV